jgi:hypothetical protein
VSLVVSSAAGVRSMRLALEQITCSVPVRSSLHLVATRPRVAATKPLFDERARPWSRRSLRSFARLGSNGQHLSGVLIAPFGCATPARRSAFGGARRVPTRSAHFSGRAAPLTAIRAERPRDLVISRLCRSITVGGVTRIYSVIGHGAVTNSDRSGLWAL